MIEISPKYQMDLVISVDKAIRKYFSSNENILQYILKWHVVSYYDAFNTDENFEIVFKDDEHKNIDLKHTLHNMDGHTLMKVAVDIGVYTPNYIPSVPLFRNEIKSSYKTAYATFEQAYKSVEETPDISIGLANSALESIIKKILSDKRFNFRYDEGDTLYDLTQSILKDFQIYPETNMPKEVKTLGSSLLGACKAIEQLRSDKTSFHGYTSENKIINNPIYAYFIINTVSSIGQLLISLYEEEYPSNDTSELELPF